jgi:CysZ protein
MLTAAFSALTDMFRAPLRAVLLKAIGLALLLIVLIGIGLQRLFAWMAQSGASWAEASYGTVPHSAWTALVWILSIMAGLGIITGAVFLMPAVTAFVGSFFVDEIADEVEREHYPAEKPGQALPLWLALIEGIKTALLTIVVYLVTLPFLFVAGAGLFILFFANAYLLGREYFLLAAMRFRSPEEARALRKSHHTQVFLAGMLIALFVSIPIVNLATPLFAMALMVHMHKRLSPQRVELIEPKRA